MKAKKSYDNGGKVKPKTSKSSRSNPNLAGRPTTPEERRKAAIEKGKAMIQRMSKTELRDQGRLRKPRSMEAGGRVMEPLGMGGKKAKLKKAAPGKSARSAMFVEGAMNQMKAHAPGNKSLKAPGKTVAEIEESKKKNKRRRRFDNGGKVKGTANVNTRGEGKKKKKDGGDMLAYPKKRIADGPGMIEYVKQQVKARGTKKGLPLKKAKPVGIKPIASKPLPAKKLKKSKAVIPVPPAKGRRKRNRK